MKIVGFDLVLVLMEYGAYRQILLQVFECLFHGNELDIVRLPQQCGIVLGEIGAQQITPFAAASTSQLLTVECVGERGAFLVHLDIDQAPCGGVALARAAPSFISISSRETSMPVSSRRRFHNHFSCRLRIASPLCDAIVTLSEDVKFTVVCQQFDHDAFAGLLPRLVQELLFQTREAPFRRSHSDTAPADRWPAFRPACGSVGMPRSITQTRRANARRIASQSCRGTSSSVLQSLVLPASAPHRPRADLPG